MGGKPCATLARREWWGCSAAFGGLEGQLAPGESKETLLYKLFFFWLLTPDLCFSETLKHPDVAIRRLSLISQVLAVRGWQKLSHPLTIAVA